MKSESKVTQSCLTPWTAAYQAPPSMGFSRQEYWSGVPSPFPKTDIDYIKGFVFFFEFVFSPSVFIFLNINKGCIYKSNFILK